MEISAANICKNLLKLWGKSLRAHATLKKHVGTKRHVIAAKANPK